MKLTPQRRLIAQVLHDEGGRLTAEELVCRVQARMPGVNKSTIYRTLELLENAGCVFKREVGGESVYYHADEAGHHHLVCAECGKTVECDEGLFLPLEKTLRESYGFEVSFRNVVLNGLCADCKEKH